MILFVLLTLINSQLFVLSRY